jgi:hypothetical protein
MTANVESVSLASQVSNQKAVVSDQHEFHMTDSCAPTVKALAQSAQESLVHSA